MTIKTKYGTAYINKQGYYVISSSKEGNENKLLHRLIFREHFGKIPKGYQIHHKDGDRINNNISNLECISHSEHSKLHHTGRKNSLKTMEKMSEWQNSTGLFRVYKQKDKQYKQGFRWRYQYYNGGKMQKAIQRVNLKELEEEVKKRGLEWAIIDGNLAKQSYEENAKYYYGN